MIFQFSRNQVFVALIFIFLCVQVLGIFTAQQYLMFIEMGELQPLFENPQDIMNSVMMIFYIMVMTVFLILIIRYKKWLLRVLEAFAIFFTSAIVFDALLPHILGLGEVLALLLTAVKVLKPSHLTQNVALIFSVAGAGAIIGISFGVLPVLVFMLLLSVYDFIAVFITKHMVYMAKAITERPTAFTAALPCKTEKYEHTFQLGGGDLVIPLVFAISVMNYHGFWPMIFTITGALVAMMALFAYVLKEPGNALPALPPISAGACIGFVIALLL